MGFLPQHSPRRRHPLLRGRSQLSQVELAAMRADRHLACPSADIPTVLDKRQGVVFANHEEVRTIFVPRTNHPNK